MKLTTDILFGPEEALLKYLEMENKKVHHILMSQLLDVAKDIKAYKTKYDEDILKQNIQYREFEKQKKIYNNRRD